MMRWHPDNISTNSQKSKTNPKFPFWLALVAWWHPDKIEKVESPRQTSSSLLPCWSRGGDGSNLPNFTVTGVKAATGSCLPVGMGWRRVTLPNLTSAGA